MTFHDFRKLPDGIAEFGHLAATVRGQFDVCKYHRVKAQFSAINDQTLRLDQTGILESLYTPPAG